jgi:formate dehydrogenase major subunit
VLYLLGELPPDDSSKPEFTIFQNIYPPEPHTEADLVLPSAATSEVNGNFINGEGRIQAVRKAVQPPVNALPDWEILCMIARKMGAQGFEFQSVEDIRKEMAVLIPEFACVDDEHRQPRAYRGTGRFRDTKESVSSEAGKDGFMMTVSAIEHVHRGFPLATWVEGSRMLLTEGMVEMNPEDAAELGIVQGDVVVLGIDGLEMRWPARILREQPRGTLHASLREWATVAPNPRRVGLRKALPEEVLAAQETSRA